MRRKGRAKALCISYYQNLQVFSGISSEILQKIFSKRYIERYFEPPFTYSKYLKISLVDYKEKIANQIKYLKIKI